MKKIYGGLIGFVVALLFSASSVMAADVEKKFSIQDEHLVAIDTGAALESYELEVYVDPNYEYVDDMIIYVDDDYFKIVNGKLVKIERPNNVVKPTATDGTSIGVGNGHTSNKYKTVAKGTIMENGSTGPKELREHRIIDTYNDKTLNYIRSNSSDIGTFATAPRTGDYRFTITNYSATTQTWYWFITF